MKSNTQDVLIVFSNHNGCRRSNNIKEPRISITIDSFCKTVPNYMDWNVLLLDNNSTDGSNKILKKYASDRWVFQRKTREDFYLGTLNRLVDEFSDRYKYMLVVDNDQYFFRDGFLDTALAVMNENENVINIQLNDITRKDFFDKHGHERGIVSIFDYAGISNNEVWLRSTKYRKQSWWNVRRGIVKVPKKNLSKRDCWMWWCSSNTFLRSRVIKEIFRNKSLKPPYKNNSDRLSLFARTLSKYGDTVFLARGGSFNFGFRKKLAKGFDLKGYLESQPNRSSLLVNDEYSFFDFEGELLPISELLKRQWE